MTRLVESGKIKDDMISRLEELISVLEDCLLFCFESMEDDNVPATSH